MTAVGLATADTKEQPPHPGTVVFEPRAYPVASKMLSTVLPTHEPPGSVGTAAHVLA